MPKMPMLKNGWNYSPHIVLLGAGASVATCPDGDVNGRKLPVMENLMEILNLSTILKKEGIAIPSSNFEEIYDSLVSDKKYQPLAKSLEEEIYNYFSEIKLPDEPTIYDYLILSLREKDLIASFNWDPLLLQAYRRNIKIKKLPQMAFLHGNVNMGVCYDDKTIGYIDTVCNKCKKIFRPVKLLYPIKQKDYISDPLIKDQWDRLRHCLKIGYFFTIFGYNAPVSDIEAKKLMLEVWGSNETLGLAQINIIDIKSEEELREAWKDFIIRQHYGIYNNFFDSYLCRHPRRSCEALAAATLMLKPRQENRFPLFKRIGELHEWILPLIEEESRYEK